MDVFVGAISYYRSRGIKSRSPCFQVYSSSPPHPTFLIHEFIPTRAHHTICLSGDSLGPSYPIPTPNCAVLPTGGTCTCGLGECSRILSEVACAKVPYSTTLSPSPLRSRLPLHLSGSSNGHLILDCFDNSTTFSLAHDLAGGVPYTLFSIFGIVVRLSVWLSPRLTCMYTCTYTLRNGYYSVLILLRTFILAQS
jgi:hypothetical protein